MASKTPEALAKKRARTAEWKKANPDKVRSYQGKSYQNNRGARLEAVYKRTYGIDFADRDRMLAEQGGVCAICGTDDPGIEGRGWATDHCHKTLQVRGLLCHQCNFGIGQFKDNPAILCSAINYLEKHSQ